MVAVSSPSCYDAGKLQYGVYRCITLCPNVVVLVLNHQQWQIIRGGCIQYVHCNGSIPCPPGLSHPINDQISLAVEMWPGCCLILLHPNYYWLSPSINHESLIIGCSRRVVCGNNEQHSRPRSIDTVAPRNPGWNHSLFPWEKPLFFGAAAWVQHGSWSCQRDDRSRNG